MQAVVRFDVTDFEENAENSYEDALTNLIYQGLYEGDSSISLGFDTRFRLPATSITQFVPEDGVNETLFDAGFDGSRVGEQLVTNNLSDESYRWRGMTLKVSLSDDTARISLQAE